ncbi:MAG TPA: choice-of-anchor B family protein [Woeseiaceae bacterium]|nr:choice-of-anchor B family protein [Woeseiaceae bacterium]
MIDRTHSRSLSLALAVLAFAFSEAAGAHSVHRPLFVAETGADQGDCRDASAPCRTLAYALSMAGKGAEIRVAAGAYAVESPEVLFHLVSNSVQVVGGYARRDDFERAGHGTTTLTGVPHEYRTLLESRGFNVIADTKGMAAEQAVQAGEMLAVYDQLKVGAPAAECADGMAGALPCDSVDLLAHVAFSDLRARPAAGNDVWGFVDLNTGREYAIAGFDNGTAVIDVTDPASPVEVGFVRGEETTWRDIKVYQFFDAAQDRWHAYAYVTADAASDQLVVIDLAGLPNSIAKAPYDGDFLSAHNLYLAGADYSTGLAVTDQAPVLVIAGSNIGSGQYRSYSLAAPAAPAFVGGGTAPDYMHDATSVVITDARKSACPHAGDFCEVLADFDEDSIDLWDITDPADPARLSRTGYDNVGYTHSGWWSEDRQFLFVHDEQDEQRFGFNTTLRVFSLADLAAPVQVGEWQGPTKAIDHNGFVRGNRYYISNYSRGLTILDISDPKAPAMVGWLDTYPFSDSTGFQGAWGAYPFFFSGTVAVNDIDSGLFLARDGTRDTPEGRLGFAAASVAGDEGRSAELVVQRTGGSAADVSVGFEVLEATAEAADFQLGAGRLAWPAGDASARTIEIPLTNDGAAEGLERLFVRLVDPQGGATLGEVNVASVYLGDPAAPATVGFFESTVEILEGGFGKAILVLRRGGSAGAPVSVDYALAGGSAAAGSDFEGSTSGTVAWAAGDGKPKNLVFDVATDDGTEGEETFEIRLSNPSGATIAGSASATVTIAEPLVLVPTPPAEPPGDNGGGSGALGWLLFALLAPFACRSHRWSPPLRATGRR